MVVNSTAEDLGGGDMIALFDINDVAIMPGSVGYAARRIDAHPCVDQRFLDPGERAQLIVALNQDRMIRTGQRPSQLFRQSDQQLASLRENGQLDAVRAERYRAESQQINLFRG